MVSMIATCSAIALRLRSDANKEDAKEASSLFGAGRVGGQSLQLEKPGAEIASLFGVG
jgi:hypothetical protein